MDINKIKIAVIPAILISGMLIFLIIGYFIWIFFPKQAKSKPEQAFIPFSGQNVRVPKSAGGEALPENLPSSGELNVPILPIPKPDLGILSKEKILPISTMPFFENIYQAAKSAEANLKKEIAAPTQTAPDTLADANILKSASAGIPISLTNDEFRLLYPDTFIASLMDAQNLLQRYDPTYEPLSKIETDSQVRFVEENIIAALFSANMLTKDEAERFITTIRFTLPQLQLMELGNRKLQGFNQSLPLLKGPFFSDLIERLNSALKPRVAVGKGSCGACFDLPECFQEGAFSPLPGSNIFKAFCYCTGCLYGQGCLDFCSGQAAIYDPMTGICGCGVY